MGSRYSQDHFRSAVTILDEKWTTHGSLVKSLRAQTSDEQVRDLDGDSGTCDLGGNAVIRSCLEFA